MPGGASSVAHAVSADGAVIFGNGDSTAGVQAFRWTAETGMMALGSFMPLATCEDVTILVGERYASPDFPAVIWDEANGLRSLEEMLEIDLGLDLGGWTLWSPTDISSDGTIIVGYGTNPLGRSEGWVAVIPEPCSLALLAVGGFACLIRRR